MSDPSGTPIVVTLTPEQQAAQSAATDRDSYIHRLLVALDDFGNVVLFNGACDETISSHTARMALKHEFIGAAISRALDLIQANHGAKAIAADKERAEIVIRTEDSSGALGK